MEYLVKGEHYSRWGTGVESYEILSQTEYDILCEAIANNYTFYVHEWSGKHSEELIDPSESITLITTDHSEIATFRRLLGSSSIGNIGIASYIIESWQESEEYYDLHGEDDE